MDRRHSEVATPPGVGPGYVTQLSPSLPALKRTARLQRGNSGKATRVRNSLWPRMVGENNPVIAKQESL